jgi:flavin reductase (DIM6/NTAB) family NADH-FMN oxidoreductase RutF
MRARRVCLIDRGTPAKRGLPPDLDTILGEPRDMDANDKKQALRMIPYGLYVLTAEAADGQVAASTVNWVTQGSFEPPLVAVGVKTDSGAHSIIKESKVFVGEVVDAGLSKPIEGRPDDATLALRDLGQKTFYGG